MAGCWGRGVRWGGLLCSGRMPPCLQRANTGVLCRHLSGAVSLWTWGELCSRGPAPGLPTSPPRSQLGLLGFRGEMRAGSLCKPLTQVQASSIDDHVGTGPQGSRVGEWPGKGAGLSAMEADGPGLGSWPCLLHEAVLTSAPVPGLWEAGLGLCSEAQ